MKLINFALLYFVLFAAFLTAVMKGVDGDVWIGLRNAPGQWGWEDGTPLTYENWAPGQPDSVSINSLCFSVCGWGGEGWGRKKGSRVGKMDCH